MIVIGGTRALHEREARTIPVRAVELSEELYQSLRREAERLNMTPEQALTRLLALDLAALLDDGGVAAEPTLPGNPTEAMAAVQRLTALFADVARPSLQAILDPRP
jgi:hypothetical protein